MKIKAFSILFFSLTLCISAIAAENNDPYAGKPRYVITANEEWHPFKMSHQILPGSPLDFSFINNDAPAGKYGWLKVVDDHFEFEKRPGERVRFFGTNLCYGVLFCTHEQADELAVRLRRLGFNAARIHHYDRDIIVDNGKDSHTIDPEKLDRLDYLISALEKQGIYISIDLYTDRISVPGEFELTDERLNGFSYKSAIIFSKEVNAKFKGFVKEMLTHTNPYTGTCWADDPAINTIDIINEDHISAGIPNHRPYLKDELMGRFNERANREGWNDEKRNDPLTYTHFVLDEYKAFYDDMKAFLTSLGVKALLTDQNDFSWQSMAAQRVTYDYVDNHVYFGHVRFLDAPWTNPFTVEPGSSLAKRLPQVTAMATSRIWGKPFTVTEFDHPYHNPWRAEGNIIFYSQAAWQNWDGIFHFDFVWNPILTFEKYTINIFDEVNDPTRLFGELLAAAFYARGDVKPAAARIELPLVLDKAPDCDFPHDIKQLSFEGAIGIKPVESPEPHPTPFIRNAYDHGQWKADFQASTYLVDTTGSWGAVVPANQTLESSVFSTATTSTPFIGGAIALGTGIFSTTDKILLLMLPDVRNSNEEYLDSECLIHIKAGTPPLLAKHMTATITASLPEPNAWTLTALDTTGAPMAQLPITVSDNKLILKLDNFTASDNDVPFAFLLERK